MGVSGGQRGGLGPTLPQAPVPEQGLRSAGLLLAATAEL